MPSVGSDSNSRSPSPRRNERSRSPPPPPAAPPSHHNIDAHYHAPQGRQHYHHHPVHDSADQQDLMASTTLYVGNLPYSWSSAMVEDLFSKYGHIKSARVVEKQEGGSKGYGFVEYEERKNAQAAFEALQGYDAEGRTLRLDWDVGLDKKRQNPRPPRRDDRYRGGYQDRHHYGGYGSAPGGYYDRPPHGAYYSDYHPPMPAYPYDRPMPYGGTYAYGAYPDRGGYVSSHGGMYGGRRYDPYSIPGSSNSNTSGGGGYRREKRYRSRSRSPPPRGGSSGAKY